ncbi:MAG: hypothetical protein ACRECY_12205 [Phyllobacterium sp.]
MGDAALFIRVGEDVFDEPIDLERLAAYLATHGYLMVLGQGIWLRGSLGRH